MNKSVEHYFLEGCGRCPLGATPDCKVHTWTLELKQLRQILLDTGLNEEAKWGAPCYTYQGKNVLMLSALKDYTCISFFKGSLLKDELNLLLKPGPNSQAARLIKFIDTQKIKMLEDQIKAYVFEAIEIEKQGLKVEFKKELDALPKEVESRFDEDAFLKTAFESLTPGRQRAYIIYFAQAKQEKTRMARIEKCMPMIMAGIGLHDKYQSDKKGKGPSSHK